MDEIDAVAYERWRQWQEGRVDIVYGMRQRISGDRCPPRPPFEPLYDEWMKLGKPNEQKIKKALWAFGGMDFDVYKKTTQ